MTVATKTIKIDDATHRRLKLMAAKSGEHVYQIVARLVRQANKKSVNPITCKDENL